MSNFQNVSKRPSRSPLRDGFLDEIDKMGHDDLKLVTRQCICNLQEATNLLTNAEKFNCTDKLNYNDEKKKVLDDYQKLLFKIQQCCLHAESSNPTKVNALEVFDDISKHHSNQKESAIVNKESTIETPPAKPSRPWNSYEFKKFIDNNEDLLAYHQKMNRTLSKTVDDLREKLKIRTQQWQVTLNLYLKEKYEHGEGLTTLEKIAKEKYRTFHRESKRKEMEKYKEKLDKDSCTIF